MKPALIVVGLGNPGAQYERTRHNVGFRALDVLAREWGEGEWKDQPKFRSITQEARLVTAPVLLVKPQLFMNRSGETVRKIVDFYELNPAEQLIVISDDVDLPVGELRFKRSGGPGTHNGLKSVVEQLGEEFARLRIGLGRQPPGADLAAWVLSAPSPAESELLEEACERVPQTLREALLKGIEN